MKESKVTKSVLLPVRLVPYVEYIQSSERISLSAALSLLIENEIATIWPDTFKRYVYQYQVEAQKNQSPV